jgi:PhoPQ-activated pathogenicity-related protein
VAFTRRIISEQPMPKLSWKHDDEGDKLRLAVKSDTPPSGARLWVAAAPTRDFRKMTWREQPAQVQASDVVGTTARPEQGYVAFFAELDFATGEIGQRLSTQIRVVEATKR